MEYKNLNTISLATFLFFCLATLWVWSDNISESFSSTSSEKKIASDNMETQNFEEINLGDNEGSSNTETSSAKVKEHNQLQQKNQQDKKQQDKKMPKEINLNVPFIPQAPTGDWSQPWQDACEEAGVLMLDAYYKDYELSPVFAEDEIKKMVDWEENEKGWGDSIEIEKIADLIEYYVGKEAQIFENPTVDQIKRQVASGNPVLVVAYGKDIPNPYYTGDGPLYHVLIIKGYNESEFITNDPGTKRGKNFRYKYNEIMNVIHDWNGGDVESGVSKMLTLKQ
ncbi:MAG: C39 family peptidase [Candidatus Magasanikbacteria bacterium]